MTNVCRGRCTDCYALTLAQQFKTFWKPDTFPKVEEADLTPHAFDDPLAKLADEVRQALLN